MQLRFSAKFIILSLVSMILLLSSQRHAQAQSEPIACGETVSGEITDDKAQDYWWFAGQAGQTVTISMWGDVDSALLLADTGGYVLARSTGIGDAYLEQTITETATYTIEATRRGGESSDSVGAYELLLECAAPVSQAGATVTTETELAAAIRASNQNAEADVISLGADITLTAELPRISSSITILGNEHSISGNERVRIFFVTESGALSLRDAIFRDGAADGATTGGNSLCLDPEIFGIDTGEEVAPESGSGGAICNHGSLEVSGSVFSGNISNYLGGAIVNLGKASISGSVFSGNSAELGGGAIVNLDLTLMLSISDNLTEEVGDAIVNFGEASISISDSDFSGNSAEFGGAITNLGSISISGSDFSGNSADFSGGAIATQGELSISDSEFSGNSADAGGAIWNDEDGEAIISKSVFSDNSPQDCHGVVCHSAPDGGASGQVGVSASENDDLASQAGATVTTETELAAAIRAANQNAEADVISLGADITLTEELPTISSSITILGNEHSISGNERVRIFFVTESGALTLRDAILRDGATTGGNSLCFDPEIFGIDIVEEVAPEFGGAICNHGSLEVSDSVFSGNSAVRGGGAIFNLGEASISDSVFSNNTAEDSGGAIVHLDIILMLSTSDIPTEVVGDAIVNFGEASISISESNFSDNSAYIGGAIFNFGEVSISDSEFSGNSAAGGGGAIATQGELSISDSVFRDNSAGELGLGGAIWNNDDGEVSISSSVFSDNSPQDCHGVVCHSAPDGGASGQVGVGASPPDELASPSPSRISYGESATDSLSDSRAYIDFPFQAQAGDNVLISMDATSGNLDPLLKLYDDAGNELANDDDSGDGRNALIEFRIPSAGEFVINAGRYAGSGDFRVSLSLAETRAAQAPQAGATVTTETELAAAIRAANDSAEDDVISLGADITLTAALPGISSSITILGNGHSISGNESVRIFFVAENGSLRIEHLTLEDGATGNICGWNYIGAAICNLGSLEVRSSIFSGNSTRSSGGAIANIGEANISYSEFNGNSAVGLGGAIHNYGELSIIFSEFNDNSAKKGGAIWNAEDDEAIIIFSEFNGNSAEEGGAIWNDEDGEAIISKSVFSDNSPQDCHGVVCRSVPDGGPSGQVGVSASESDDLASQAGATVSTATALAAAIRAANQNAEADVISLGADITLTAEPFTISSSIIILGNGHSISGNDQLRIFTITESGALTLRDAILRDGAVREGSLCLDPDIFEIDSGEVAASGLGGAICNNGSLEVSGSVFIGNSAVGGGGAILNLGEASISGSVLSVNSAEGFGGAILNLGEASISDSDFSDNSAEDGGGAITNVDLAFYGISISDNPTEEDGDEIVNFGEINISGSEFSDNSAEEGGAIANIGEASISGSVFSGNSADWGGAIANRGELSISASNFSGNRAYFGSKSNNGGLGGAIFNLGEVSISDSVFSGNTSVGHGGAILNFDFGEVSIGNSEFSGNISNIVGGAITNLREASISISDSEFSGNSSSNGGAIWHVSDGEVSISNSVFSDNSPQNCRGVACRSVPDGGPSGQVGVSASDAPAIPGAASGSPSEIILAHEKLLAVENVACSASDSYFILRLKTDSVLNQHFLEINLNTRGDARIAQVVPLPEADSYGEDVNWVDFSELVEAGVQQVSSFLIEKAAESALGPKGGAAIKVLEFGSDVQRWVDERYTRGQSPAGLRLTWYNTGVDPAVARYLVHVTHSSDGSLGLSTSLAPLTIFAQTAAAQHNELKPSYEGDYLTEALNFFSGKTIANATKDLLKPLIPEDLQYLIDFSPAAVMAYFTERVAINRDAMEISQPVAIC